MNATIYLERAPSANIKAYMRDGVAWLNFSWFEHRTAEVIATLNRAQVLDLQQKLAALEWPTPQPADVEFDVERAR